MDEVCYCNNGLKGLQEIFNCLLEKSRVSLPVLVSACALGYIWVASKHQKDIKRQFGILEDDVKKIKRENLFIFDEIRRYNRTYSDPEILSSLIKANDRSRPTSKHSPFSEKICRRQSPDRERSYGHKNKKRKSRKTYCCAEPEHKIECISMSSPEVHKVISCDLSVKSGCSHTSPLPISNFEWSPRAESTNIGQDLMVLNKDYLQLGKQNKVPLKSSRRSNLRNTSINKKTSKRHSGSRSVSPRHKTKFTDACVTCDYSNRNPLKCGFDDVKTRDKYCHLPNDDKASYKSISFKYPDYDLKYDEFKDANCSWKCGDVSNDKRSRRVKKALYHIEELCCPTKTTDRTARTIDRIDQLKLKISQDLSLPESSKCTARCSYKSSPFFTDTNIDEDIFKTGGKYSYK